MSNPDPSVYVIVEESRELTSEQWDIIKKLLRGWDMRGVAEVIQTEHQPTHWLEYARANLKTVQSSARERLREDAERRANGWTTSSG